MSLQSRSPQVVASPAARGPVRPHGPLAAVTVVTIAALVLTLIGVFADDRTLGGAPVWLKPLKFTLSFGVYAATLAWLLPRVARWRRAGWWAGTFVAGALLLELGCIAFQAGRGVASHFNTVTPTDALVIQFMSVGVMLLYAGNLFLILVLMRDSALSADLRWAFRLGLILALAAMVEGFFMNAPTADQLLATQAGRPTLVGAHTVGAPDGGPGLPLTTWSTAGGDLRIPHFFGLHALQLLPLLVLLLVVLGRRLPALSDTTVRVRLVFVAALGHAGLFGLLTWQALRGQPLLRPDTATLTGLAIVALVTAGAAALAVTSARPAAARG